VTTDERLDRLVDRHEALAQSLELLHASVQELRTSVEAHDRYLATIMKGVQQLLEVATNHERRLNRLESKS
jgi:prefoldin subunit 5